MEYGTGIVYDAFYYYGAHSEYDHKEKRFNHIYSFCDIKFDLAHLGRTGDFDVETNSMHEALVIPIEGEIPELIIECMRKIRYKDYRLYFKHYQDKNNNEILVTIYSLIMFLELLNIYYSKVEHMGNNKLIKKSSEELISSDTLTPDDLLVELTDLDKIVDYCEKRYKERDCLLPWYVDLNYLSEAAFNFYLNKVGNKAGQLDLNILHLLKCLNDLDFLKDNLSKDNNYYKEPCYLAITNKKTDTFMQEFTRIVNSAFRYSIMRRYTISNLNKEINQEFLNDFLKYFFGKVPDVHLIKIEHRALSKYADQYDRKEFENTLANNLCIAFENISDGDYTDKKTKRYLLSYGVCDGSLEVYDLPIWVKKRMSTEIDKKYICDFLQMINKLIEIDIKNISKKDNVYAEDNQRKLVPNKK